MAWLRALVLVWLGVLGARALCPSRCECSLDARGRNRVACTQGDLHHIPVADMELSTEVVVISAPDKDRENFVHLGPIFIGPNVFTELEEIHITLSNVPSIGLHSFWGLQKLKILNLNDNNITSVIPGHFRGLLHLQELHLDNNFIEEMASETFKYLEDLKVLSLARNRISELAPRLFKMLGKLTQLNLSDNPLRELFPEVFKDIGELKVLKCRRCLLTIINTQLYNYLSGLQHLDLGENLFKYVMAFEFTDLKNLHVLKYDGNQLPVVLEKTFGNQNNLKSLCLSRNRLAMVTRTAFTNLSMLQDLDLSFNKLDKLDVNSFLPVVDSLWTLNLSGNRISIEDITFILQILTNIRNLGLAQLDLFDLPLGIFSNNLQLKTLNLSGNKFISFPHQVLAPTPYLAQLDLTHNSFNGMDEKTLIRLAMISKVNLNFNPWVCDLCHVDSMLTYLKDSYLNESLKDLVCTAPKHYKGYHFSWLAKSELQWCTDNGSRFMQGNMGLFPEEGRMIAALLVLLVFVVIAALAVGICYSKRRAARYYTNEDKRGPQSDKMFDNQLVIFGENDDLNFKFPVTDISEKPFNNVLVPLAVSTIITPQ